MPSYPEPVKGGLIAGFLCTVPRALHDSGQGSCPREMLQGMAEDLSHSQPSLQDCACGSQDTPEEPLGAPEQSSSTAEPSLLLHHLFAMEECRSVSVWATVSLVSAGGMVKQRQNEVRKHAGGKSEGMHQQHFLELPS